MDDVMIGYINKNTHDTNDIDLIKSIVIFLSEDEKQEYLLTASQRGNLSFIKIFKDLNVELSCNDFELLRECVSYNNSDCAKFIFNLHKNDINLEKYKNYSSYKKMKNMLQ